MSKLFSYTHDENQIWNLAFHSSSRDAVQEYIETITQLNQQILSGDIQTRNPICIIWDFRAGYFPNIQKMIVESRLNPPPENFTYRIAYLLSSQTNKRELEAYQTFLSDKQTHRKWFLSEHRQQAIAWLLSSDDKS